MSQNTSNDKSVKVLSDTREEEILDIFRTLHGKVLTALQECDINPLFPTEFGKCGSEAFKDLHQQSRALIISKRKDRNDKRVAGVRSAIASVVNAHMSAARAAKAQMEAMPQEVRQYLPAFPSTVKVPLSDIRPCFPKGESDTQVFADLEYMGYKVTEFNAKGAILVPFKTETPKSEETVKAA